MERLLKQGVLALTGVVNSAVMLGIRNTVEKARVPLVGSNASPTTCRASSTSGGPRTCSTSPAEPSARTWRRVRRAGSAMIAPDNGSRDVIQRPPAQFGGRFDDPRITDPVILTTPRPAPGENHLQRRHQQGASRTERGLLPLRRAAAVEFIKQLHRARYRRPIYAPGLL